MAIETQALCALCELEITARPFTEGKLLFCCAGCHAVHTILVAKSELERGIDHPLVKEAALAGLISNPLLLEELQAKKLKEDKEDWEKVRKVISIQGLWCPSCALLIQYVLSQKKGVVLVIVDYATDMGVIEYYPRYIDLDSIVKVMTNLGYEVDLQNDQALTSASRGLKIRSAVTGFFALNVMMFAYPLYATYFDAEAKDYGMIFAWLSFWAALPVMTYGAWPIYKRFWAALRTGYFGMETLVVLGAGSATLLSTYRLLSGNMHVYFDTACVIVALVLGGKLVEAKAKFNAKKTLAGIARSQPKRGRKRFSDAKFDFVPIADIHVGDEVKTLAGEKVILDGVVVGGEATCDESLLTGESLPVAKSVGSKIIGGSIVLHGAIVWEVKATVEESLQQRILQLVQTGIGNKAVKEQRIEVILRYFIPAVLLLTVCAFMGSGGNFEQALSVLLIACPCALGIAVPLVESQLIQSMAERGALVRNRSSLQFLGREDVIVFDKTGTITKGYLQVQSPLGFLSAEQRIAIANIARQSTHPVAQAIARGLQNEVEVLLPVLEHAGKGMEGKWKDKVYRIGSAAYFNSLGYPLPSSLDCIPGSSPCFLFEGVSLLAQVFLADSLKPEIKQLLGQFQGIKTILLSGDNPQTVAFISKECGFDSWYAEQNPLQKRDKILELKNNNFVVGMVGDGINDAPALTAADVAISVVSATDISIQVSDILLTTEKLDVLLPIRELAKKARRLIKQNLFWTFFYNVIGIGLALSGYLSPIYSAVAMTASSIIVVLNAQRLTRIFTK
ncbi:MAG: cation-translocating P-type ATPase [Parachlamydiales bacterium]|jgi:heavy metal translocating P-type ATPase